MFILYDKDYNTTEIKPTHFGIDYSRSNYTFQTIYKIETYSDNRMIRMHSEGKNIFCYNTENGMFYAILQIDKTEGPGFYRMEILMAEILPDIKDIAYMKLHY